MGYEDGDDDDDDDYDDDDDDDSDVMTTGFSIEELGLLDFEPPASYVRLFSIHANLFFQAI